MWRSYEMWGCFNTSISSGMHKTCSDISLHWNWRKIIRPLSLGKFFFFIRKRVSFYTKKAGTFNLKAFNFSAKQKVELEPTTTICTWCGMNLMQRLNLHELGIHFDLCLTIVPIYDGICRLCGRVSLVILDPWTVHISYLQAFCLWNIINKIL